MSDAKITENNISHIFTPCDSWYILEQLTSKWASKQFCDILYYFHVNKSNLSILVDNLTILVIVFLNITSFFKHYLFSIFLKLRKCLVSSLFTRGAIDDKMLPFSCSHTAVKV